MMRPDFKYAEKKDLIEYIELLESKVDSYSRVISDMKDEFRLFKRETEENL